MDNCIFCKIGAGQIKADVVVEGERFIAFRDIQPQAPVHILIIPKKHITSVASLNAEDAVVCQEMVMAARKIAEKEGVAQSGFRLVTNSGADSGQTVPHLHFHLLAGRTLSWPPG